MELDLLNDRDLLVSELGSLMRETSLNVHGFGLGHKIVSGQQTEDLCLTYFVHQKRPLHVIDEKDLIPEYIYLNEKKIKTDVVERGFAEFLVTCNNFDATPTPFNVAEHRRAHRPLIGGVHLINMYTNAFLDGAGGTNQNQVYNRFAGTLGGLVVDNDTNTVVGLTNAHVIVKDYTYAHNRSLTKEIYNIYDDVAIARFTPQNGEWRSNGTFISGYDQVIIQDLTNATVNTGTAVIGRPKKYTPAAASTPTCFVMNTVDAAICTLRDSSLLSSGVSNTQLGILPTTVTNIPFATTQEINSCLDAIAISAGARTGPKGESCGLKITRVGVAVTINYKVPSQGSNVDLYFADLIEVDYSDGQGIPVGPGDSGSFLLAKFGSTFKVIGLIFAGSFNSTFTRGIGYACRIDNIQKALNISQWDGRQLPVDSLKKGTVVVTPKDFKGSSFDLNGVTFYQAGIGSAPNNIYPTGSQEYWDEINNRLACSGDNPFCNPVVGRGLVGYKVETIYVHANGDPSDAVCYPPERILPPCFVGEGLLDFATFHAESVFINEPPFPCRIFLESGLVNNGPDIEFKLTYEPGPGHAAGKQWLFFEEAPLPAGYNPATAILKSGLSGFIGSGGSGFNFHIVPQPDPTNSIKIDDGERCFIYARSKTGKNYPLSFNGNDIFLSQESASEIIRDNQQFEINNNQENISLTSTSCAINPGNCCEPAGNGKFGVNYYNKTIYAIQGLALGAGNGIMKTCSICPPRAATCIENPTVCPGVTINDETVVNVNNLVIARAVGTPTTPGTYTTKVVFNGQYGGAGGNPGQIVDIQEVWTVKIIVQPNGGGGGGGGGTTCGPNDFISGWYDASGSFLVFTSGSGQGPGGDNVGVDNPCGGGHVCNRADFDIKMHTELISGYTVLSGQLNNAGGAGPSKPDNGPGPFPYNGQFDRYSSRIITDDDNLALFGFSGVRTGSETGVPLFFKISIVPSSGNDDPHLGVTWVRILNECNEVIYSCCLGEGGGTTAPPGWQPPPYSPNSFKLEEFLENIDFLSLDENSKTIFVSDA